MTKFGIKLAEEKGLKNQYKELRALAKGLDYEFIFFEDFDEYDTNFKFYTAELMKSKELEFASYSLNIDEVLRGVENFLKGKEEDE